PTPTLKRPAVSRMLKKATFSPAQPQRAQTRCSAGKAAASEEARRYLPHFVRPFTLHMIPGERKTPLSILGSLRRYPHVEPLTDARTMLADFFSILFRHVLPSSPPWPMCL